MTKDEQKQFIETACETLKENMLKNLNKIPPDWDGMELRWYLQSKANEFVWQSQNEYKGRHRKYKNHMIVNNL